MSDPSFRWPHLPQLPSFTPPPPPSPSDPSPLPSSVSFQRSSSRSKKMSKLELKRDKDWRERVEHLSLLILSLPPHRPVADVLDSRPVQMTPTDYSFVLKRVGSQDWRRALEAYEWLNIRHWHSPDHRMLSAIISILGRASQDHLAIELFARASNADLPVQVYNAIMGVHARRGHFDEVRKIFDLMHSRGCTADLITFNTMINARAKAGCIAPGEFLEILIDVRSAGLCPDTVTYNTLISACSSLEDAIRVYNDMRFSRCQPDLWTYNAMVSVHGRLGKAADAERLFLEMPNNGFVPDAVTYNSLLHAFAKEGKVEVVERVCREMCAAGLKKDEITYNTIIHMYSKRGMVESALLFYMEMRDNGCRPDLVTYTVLIDCLGKAGRVSNAASAMLDMVNSGLRPTLKMFCVLICAYAKAGKYEEAERTFNHMVSLGIKPDNHAYSIIIDVALRSGDVSKAHSLYQDMVRNGFRLDQAVCRAMLITLAKNGRVFEDLVHDMRKFCGMSLQSISSILINAECFDGASNVMKEAILQGEKVEHDKLSCILNSYSANNEEEKARVLLAFVREHAPNFQDLIKILCANNQVEAAIEEYNKLTGFGSSALYMRSNLFESLITCCEESELFSKACQLFSDMEFHSIKPSLATYKSMINIYCKIGFPETANYLLDRAMGAGLLVNDILVYVPLMIEMYGKFKLPQKAEELVIEIRQKGVAGGQIWNSLIYAYAESGLYEQGRAAFNAMIEDGVPPSVDSVNGLIQALIVDKRLDEIYVVIQELQDMDLKISKSTMLLMLDAFARAGNIFEVKKIYNGMKEAGYLPSIHIYRSMLSLFCRGKRVRDVETMLIEMEEASFKPDLTIYNSMIRMYIKIEDFRKGVNVHQKIQQAGIEKDEETYNLLILMYSKDRKPEEALSLLNEMKMLGWEPNLEIYKSLIAACGREQLWEQAEDLFDSIQSKSYKLNRSFYHVMMKIYRESGDHNKAERVLSEMKSVGIQPTIATMHMLMDTYGGTGQPQQAEHVLKNLKTSGLDLSTLPYSSVIDAYLRSGNYNMATKIFLDMKSDGVQPDHRIWTCFIRGASICSQTSEAMLLLNLLEDSGFNIPIRLLTEKSELLVGELDFLLDKIGAEDNASLNFVNALEDLLWAFECRATASWIFQLAIRKGIYRHDVFRVADKNWGADFRKLSAGAAFVGLTLWLDHMQDASLQGFPESPKSVVLVTGAAEYHMASLNKSLKVFLWEMGSPFMPCKTRTGLLVAKGHSLRMWLKESSFCMDLELRDAPSLPKSNSVQLIEGYLMRAGLVSAFKDIQDRLGQVSPKKFARLALMSDERRDKVITADIEGRKEKLEKMMRKGFTPRRRKARRLRTAKFMRRRHINEIAQG